MNIYPQEAENLLVMHPKLDDAAVFGVPNDEYGEEVELIAYCRADLAAYKCPRTIDFDRQLPRDPNGKLYKRRIRDRFREGRRSRIL